MQDKFNDIYIIQVYNVRKYYIYLIYVAGFVVV